VKLCNGFGNLFIEESDSKTVLWTREHEMAVHGVTGWRLMCTFHYWIGLFF